MGYTKTDHKPDLVHGPQFADPCYRDLGLCPHEERGKKSPVPKREYSQKIVSQGDDREACHIFLSLSSVDKTVDMLCLHELSFKFILYQLQ